MMELNENGNENQKDIVAEAPQTEQPCCQQVEPCNCEEKATESCCQEQVAEPCNCEGKEEPCNCTEQASPVAAPVEELDSMLTQATADAPKLNKGDAVEGPIVGINESSIFVNLGGKHDAIAEVDDFKDKEGNMPYQVGDTLKGFINRITDSSIFISRTLSRQKAERAELREAFEREIPVQGKVTTLVKGGLSVDLSGTRAFCPVSQIDNQYVQDQSRYVGNSYDFKIIEYTEGGRSIIVSRRALLEKDQAESRKKIMETLQPGTVMEGRVSRLTNFGAFVDLGGVDGLVHISAMSWGRVESPSEVVKIGDTVRVKITKIDGDRISLSMKAVAENPLDKALTELQLGHVVNVRVLRNEGFGSFVEIQPGVEGLIPISQMSRHRRINHPSEVLRPGDRVEAEIIKVDRDSRQISLSIKALQPDPWERIDELVQVGANVIGIVENITDFGAFIRLAEGLTGLLPKSKINQSHLNLGRDVIGNEIEVRVAEINFEKKRISLEPLNYVAPEGDEHQQREPRERGPRREHGNREDEDWRRYTRTQKQDVPEDNPFRNL